MKVLLTIGYWNFLLPDEAGVMTIIKTLSKGIQVRDRLHKGALEEVADDIPEISFKTVPKGTRLIPAPKKNEPKALHGGMLLLEEKGRSGE